VIIINTAIGMLQEGKAEKAAEAIKAMLSPNALVIRAGEQQTIPADQLVPGDIVLIKSGDKIPADLRLITCTNLQVRLRMVQWGLRGCYPLHADAFAAGGVCCHQSVRASGCSRGDAAKQTVFLQACIMPAAAAAWLRPRPCSRA
jgi:hypothetical protein